MKTIIVTIRVKPPTGETFQDFMHLIDYLQVNGYEYLINSDESLASRNEKAQLTSEGPKVALT